MNKKIIIPVIILISVVLITMVIMFSKKNEKSNISTGSIAVTLLSKNNTQITVQDENNIIYTFKNNSEIDAKIGDYILLKYTGILNKNNEYQDVSIINYEVLETSIDKTGIPNDWLDDGIFSRYYIQAYNKLKELTLDEKIAQLFLIRFDEQNAKEILEKYNLGGYILFEKDFKNKTEEEVKNMISDLQKTAKIPLLIAVDEEGGKVVRVSSNPNLVKEKFKSSSELYNIGGFELIKEDTIEKSKVLSNLGINLNLAPVVDVSTNPSDYMYERTLKENTNLTSEYAKTVIEASKGTGVSYTLKHFPGYGNNADTHTGTSIDTRTYDDILTIDLPPFKAGILSGAEAVLISHNIVNSIDPNNPASLSPSIHNLLRNELKFTGIIITDSMDMGAIETIEDNIVKAVLAGNDLIITTDYEKSINSVKNAINNGIISESTIEKLAFRIISWKYYKGLINENNK